MATINSKYCMVNGAPVEAMYKDGVKLYGRNLLTGTKSFSNTGDWVSYNLWSKASYTYNEFDVMTTNLNWNGLSKYYYFDTGKTYTFSLYAKYTSGTGQSSFYQRLSTDPENGHSSAQIDVPTKNVQITSEWQRFSVTVTVTAAGYVKPRLERTNNNTNELCVCGFKLEKGTTATPWTPAPKLV